MKTSEKLTKGSAITTSIFFSACTANSAKRFLMTYSPGLTSGSIVIFDIVTLLLSKVQWWMGGTRFLFTVLAGAEAVEKENIGKHHRSVQIVFLW